MDREQLEKIRIRATRAVYDRDDVLALIDAFKSAQQETQQLREQSAWRPIATAPKDAALLILTDGATVDVGGWLSAADQGAEPEEEFLIAAGWWFVNASEMTPTHWMPLPNPPVEAALAAAPEPQETKP